MVDDSWPALILKAFEAVGGKKLISALLERKHYILVIGSTGAGKTALVGALSSMEQQLVSVINRTERTTKKALKIGKISTILVDTPGEIGKLSSRMSEFSRFYQKSRVGIIIVVSNGFHEYRSSDKSEIDTADKLSEFILRHQKIELEYLEAFSSQFPYIDQVDWAIVVATKADLWWNTESIVLSKYRDSKFQHVAKKICRHGAAVRPFSSTTEPFMKTVPSAINFSESKRRDIRLNLIASLIGQMAG